MAHAQCWVHCRRMFVEALNADPGAVEEALKQIAALYIIEDQIWQGNLVGEAKRQHRLTHSKPRVEIFFDWVDRQFDRQGLLPSSPFFAVRRQAVERVAAGTRLQPRVDMADDAGSVALSTQANEGSPGCGSRDGGKSPGRFQHRRGTRGRPRVGCSAFLGAVRTDLSKDRSTTRGAGGILGSASNGMGLVPAMRIMTIEGVPLCGCQRHFGLRWAVKRAIAQHGEQDVTATSCKRDEGLVMALSLTDLAGVVGPGDRIAQIGEGRQEHRAFELFIPASGRLLTSDGRATRQTPVRPADGRVRRQRPRAAPGHRNSPASK